MIENYQLDALRAKALAQIIEAPAGLSPKGLPRTEAGLQPAAI
jgi:hypothetical protein